MPSQKNELCPCHSVREKKEAARTGNFTVKGAVGSLWYRTHRPGTEAGQAYKALSKEEKMEFRKVDKSTLSLRLYIVTRRLETGIRLDEQAATRRR